MSDARQAPAHGWQMFDISTAKRKPSGLKAGSEQARCLPHQGGECGNYLKSGSILTLQQCCL
jgi:hypothetical protein